MTDEEIVKPGQLEVLVEKVTPCAKWIKCSPVQQASKSPMDTQVPIKLCFEGRVVQRPSFKTSAQGVKYPCEEDPGLGVTNSTRGLTHLHGIGLYYPQIPSSARV